MGASTMSRVIGAVLAFVLAFGGGGLAALETDQYTPPRRPLKDLGDEFDREVESILRGVVAMANARREEHLRRTPAWPEMFRKGHLTRADRFLTEAYVTKLAFLGLSRSGTPQNRMEAFFRYGDFDPNTSLFKVRAGESVYGSFRRPITIQMLSPTIHLHRVYFGTDKLGHFFEQGYEYYEEYRTELARSRDETLAVRKAIRHGVTQEKTYYGMLVDGVYSNADLAANYAGFQFYLNLTRAVEIDGERLEPMLVLHGTTWELNRARGAFTTKPFLTDHLNEALNPSRFSKSMRLIVSQSARELSDDWLAFYGMTGEAYRERSARLRTFFGRAYGHADTELFLAAR